MTLPYIFDKSLRRWGLFLSDLPDVNWIEYVKHLEAQAEHTVDTEDRFWLQQKECLEAAEAERDRLAAELAKYEGRGGYFVTRQEWEESERLAARVTELEAHPEATCDKCGRANHTWSAPNDLWNTTVGTPDNPRGEGFILCPTCFTALVSARVEELEAALRHIEQTAAGEADGALTDFARAALNKEKT